jgi:hypothetical protein
MSSLHDPRDDVLQGYRRRLCIWQSHTCYVPLFLTFPWRTHGVKPVKKRKRNWGLGQRVPLLTKTIAGFRTLSPTRLLQRTNESFTRYRRVVFAEGRLVIRWPSSCKLRQALKGVGKFAGQQNKGGGLFVRSRSPLFPFFQRAFVNP